MNHLKIIKLLCTALTLILFNNLTSSADTIPGIPTVGESPSYMLCWAAAIKSTITYYDPSFASKTVKDVAAVYTTKDDDAPPDTIAWVIRKNGQKINLQSKWIQGKMTWAQMKAEADAKRPFVFLIRWGSPDAYYHCNVFMGYVGDSTKLYFMDPGGSGSRIYRSFEQCIGTNINNKKGYWECSYTTSLPSSVTNEISNDNKIDFNIIYNANQSGGRQVGFVFDKSNNAPSTLKFFDVSGACIYQTDISNTSKHSSVHIPYSFTPGMYYVLYGQENAQGFSILGKNSFYIIK